MTKTDQSTPDLAALLALPAGEELNRAVELWVFDDDGSAETEAALFAIFNINPERDLPTFKHDGRRYFIPVDDYYDFIQYHNNGRHYSLAVWGSRQGKSWQPALEAAVSAWRRPARDLSGSWEMMGVLIEAMHQRGYGCKCVFNPKGDWQFCDFHKNEDEDSIGINARCRFLAVCRAALAAVLGAKE